MYKTVTRNLRKRKRIAQTWSLETTTMFQPGEESIAEATYGEAEALREGRKTRGRHRLYYDHRYGVCDDLTREDMLRIAIAEAFGEAIEWNDVDGIVDEFYDTRSDPAASRRFFLNAQTSASDAWIAMHEWEACGRPDLSLKDGELVTLGFDGSVRSDATALVATSVATGHQELLGCWEPPDDADEDWQVDRESVDAAVANAMRRFEVCAFFGDPPHWSDFLDRWSAQYGARMQVYATKSKPLEWWTNRPGPMVEALQRYHEAVLEKRVTHTPPADRIEGVKDLAVTFRRHVLNARRQPSRAGLQIRKPYPKSPDRIDACMAAVLSWSARMEAVAQGVKPKSKTRYVPKRIR